MPTNDEPHATLADLDEKTTERLRQGLQSLTKLVQALWYQCPNGDDIDALRSQADDIIRSIEMGLRPHEEKKRHAE